MGVSDREEGWVWVGEVTRGGNGGGRVERGSKDGDGGDGEGGRGEEFARGLGGVKREPFILLVRGMVCD